jgi:hypothetical protein
MTRLSRYGVSAGLLAGLMVLPCVCAAAVTKAQAAYCWEYAQDEYQAAVDAGSALPDEAYEGAQEECEVQWLAIGAQWDDPANLDRLAVLGLHAGVQ